MKILFLALCTLSLPVCWAADPPAAATNSASSEAGVPGDPDLFDLFLLVGQSNMAGRGAVADSDRQPDPRVLVFGKDDQWVLQGEPIHFDKPEIVGVGLGFTFAKLAADQRPGSKIGLIPCAVGGTSIQRWKPGGDLFEAAVRRATLAMKNGRLRGILWHQGESEAAGKTGTEAYRASLVEVAKGFRQELDQPDVPFVVGELGQFLAADKTPPMPSVQAVNEAIDGLPAVVFRTVVVSSEGLEDKGDGLHFSAQAQKELGRRYFAAWQSVQRYDK